MVNGGGFVWKTEVCIATGHTHLVVLTTNIKNSKIWSSIKFI